MISSRRCDNVITKSSLLDFDLSSNKFLRTLEIPADSVYHPLRDGSLDAASRLYKYALSTIQSPSFSQVKVIYKNFTIELESSFDSRRLKELSWHRKRFELLREVHKVRDFQLELHSAPWWWCSESLTLVLKQAVAAEKARGGFDDFFPEPLVTFDPYRHFI